MSDDKEYLTFSQRNGFSAMPTQLELGTVSQKQRVLFHYAIHTDIERSRHKISYASLNSAWSKLALDIHVRIFELSPRKFQALVEDQSRYLEAAVLSFEIGELFDLIEFILRHESCTFELYRELSEVFEETKSSYRVVDRRIIALGTNEQRTAIEHAMQLCSDVGADAARQHLILAGSALSRGNWADSIGDSIHAVEAMAVRMSPETKSLGKALSKIEKTGHMNARLKTAFEQLYAYTNDERGRWRCQQNVLVRTLFFRVSELC